MSTDPNEVTAQRATMLALHAIHVQGGFSDPEREAERARAQLAQSPGSIDWAKMASELAEVAATNPGLQPTQPEPVEPPPVLVDLSKTGRGPADLRLDALYEAYPQAKADADAAAATLKAITDGIKVELTSRGPEGAAKFELRGPNGKPLRLSWQVTRRFNTKRFTAEHPDVYEAYREPAGSWKLEPIRGGE